MGGKGKAVLFFGVSCAIEQLYDKHESEGCQHENWAKYRDIGHKFCPECGQRAKGKYVTPIGGYDVEHKALFLGENSKYRFTVFRPSPDSPDAYIGHIANQTDGGCPVDLKAESGLTVDARSELCTIGLAEDHSDFHLWLIHAEDS